MAVDVISVRELVMCALDHPFDLGERLVTRRELPLHHVAHPMQQVRLLHLFRLAQYLINVSLLLQPPCRCDFIMSERLSLNLIM
jgi:hypothetical protein